MRKRMRAAMLAAVVTGFFFGALLPELFRMYSGSYAGLLSAYGLQNFGRGKLEPGALFGYVARSRMTGILLLWMSCYTPLGLSVHVLALFWLSLASGLLASLFLLRHGYQGALLFLCCVLPQWILYLSALRLELSFFLEKLPGRAGGADVLSGNSGRMELRLLGRLLLTGLSGCALETWFGLAVFQLFLNYAL